MSSTYTRSHSFTRSDARFLASNVAADLHQMQRFYGNPSSLEIEEYIEELTTLLAGGYLDNGEYGFLQNGNWILCLRYSATSLAHDTGERPGRVYLNANIFGSAWYSCLSMTDTWWALSDDERQRIEESIPVKRTLTRGPGTGSGYWTEDKTYSRNGVALSRRTFRPL